MSISFYIKLMNLFFCKRLLKNNFTIIKQYRMLQNNYLFRRIENKNIFKTFSRGYNRPLRSKLQKRTNLSTVDHNTTIDLMQTNQTHVRNISQKRYNLSSNSQRDQFITNNVNSTQKYISELMDDTQGLLTSNTVPVNNGTKYKLPNFKEISNVNLTMRYDNSESGLTNWNLRRKNEEFKLKSCLRKQKNVYNGQIDQSEFSTLYLKNQSSTTVRDKIANLQKIRNIKPNSNREAQSVPNINKKSKRCIPNFSKLISSKLKKTIEETKSMSLRPLIPM